MQERVISHYRILETIGEGGMGVVYKAQDTRLDRLVALKLVKGPHTARFEQEARAIASLNHPNICTLHDVGVHDGTPFLVMEYVEGESPRGPMPVRAAVRCAVQIAAGLASAHAAGIIHRDLKPANVRVDHAGRARILDFGLAKLIAPVDPDDETRSAVAATEAGEILGTLVYMSPEQARGEPLDARSDVFSFGALFYELLAGSAPFHRKSPVSALTAILHEQPAPLAAAAPGAPAALQTIVTRCLAKSRDERYHSGVELLADLEAFEQNLEGPRVTSARRAVTGVALVLVAALVAALAWTGLRSYRARDAYSRLMPEVERFADAGDFTAALSVAEGAAPLIGDDPEFQRQLEIISHPAAITSDPPGAVVSWKPYLAPESSWRAIGATPTTGARVPRALLRLKVEKAGFDAVELAYVASPTAPQFVLNLTLRPAGSSPPGMVPVPGGTLSYLYAGPARLDEFWLDTYEVTNREFKGFVDRGGYRIPAFWTHAFWNGAQEIAADAALAGFVDPTGRPGPATWELGTWREGFADHPVAGVSWYEAQAYCESIGKSLPTLFHWYRAAWPGLSVDLLRFANMHAVGTAERGRHASLTPYGAYDMAGNVSEWTWNAIGPKRAILGGAWSDMSYMFGEWDAHPPLSRRPTFGFRCAKFPRPPDPSSTVPLVRMARDFTTEKPVDDRTFEIYRSLYTAEPADLASSVDEVDARHPYWRREKVSYAAGYGGERVVAYLYLPQGVKPPYQTVIFFPGSNAFTTKSFEYAGTAYIDFVIRSGRALLFPVFKGSFERFVGGAPYNSLAPAAVREHLAWWSKDLGRSVDYVVSRPDLDGGRMAYYGLSLGGCDALVCLAIERRFKTAVLLAGGLHADHRYVPEDDPLHFVPRIRIPTLLIGGRDDFVHPLESAQKTLFQLLGTPPADKRHIVIDTGHTLPRAAIMKDVLGWLDRYLGPVIPG